MMEKSSALAELAGVLFACRDLETLRKTFVARVAVALRARAADLWLAGAHEEGLRCHAQWTDSAERLTPIKDGVADGILAAAFQETSPIRLSGKELGRDEFTHFPAAHRLGVESL